VAAEAPEEKGNDVAASDGGVAPPGTMGVAATGDPTATSAGSTAAATTSSAATSAVSTLPTSASTSTFASSANSGSPLVGQVALLTAQLVEARAGAERWRERFNAVDAPSVTTLGGLKRSLEAAEDAAEAARSERDFRLMQHAEKNYDLFQTLQSERRRREQVEEKLRHSQTQQALGEGRALAAERAADGARKKAVQDAERARRDLKHARAQLERAVSGAELDTTAPLLFLPSGGDGGEGGEGGEGEGEGEVGEGGEGDGEVGVVGQDELRKQVREAKRAGNKLLQEQKAEADKGANALAAAKQRNVSLFRRMADLKRGVATAKGESKTKTAQIGELSDHVTKLMDLLRGEAAAKSAAQEEVRRLHRHVGDLEGHRKDLEEKARSIKASHAEQDRQTDMTTQQLDLMDNK
jgi:chromosome segregation ATPase